MVLKSSPVGGDLDLSSLPSDPHSFMPHEAGTSVSVVPAITPILVYRMCMQQISGLESTPTGGVRVDRHSEYFRENTKVSDTA